MRALDADRRAQLTRSQQGYQELVEYYTVWAHQIKTPIAAMRLLLQRFESERGERAGARECLPTELLLRGSELLPESGRAH